MVWFSVNSTPHNGGLVKWWFLGPSFGRIARLPAPQVQVKEEIRLVTIIDQIDKEVSIIPRGALFKTPMGPIHVNRTFEGEFSGPFSRSGASFPAELDTCLGIWENLPLGDPWEEWGGGNGLSPGCALGLGLIPTTA